MAQRAAEAVRFFARQFRVGHAGHVDKAAHPEQGIQEETVEVDHPAVRDRPSGSALTMLAGSSGLEVKLR